MTEEQEDKLTPEEMQQFRTLMAETRKEGVAEAGIPAPPKETEQDKFNNTIKRLIATIQ